MEHLPREQNLKHWEVFRPEKESCISMNPYYLWGGHKEDKAKMFSAVWWEDESQWEQIERREMARYEEKQFTMRTVKQYRKLLGKFLLCSS